MSKVDPYLHDCDYIFAAFPTIGLILKVQNALQKPFMKIRRFCVWISKRIALVQKEQVELLMR